MADTDRGTATWASGSAYEHYVGRWSRPVARAFLTWLAVPTGSNWIEVGCGTGALSQTILRQAMPARLVGIDPSEGFLAHARAHVADPRAKFLQGDARALPAADGEFDAAVSGLVLNFVPDQAAAVAQIDRKSVV